VVRSVARTAVGMGGVVSVLVVNAGVWAAAGLRRKVVCRRRRCRTGVVLRGRRTAGGVRGVGAGRGPRRRGLLLGRTGFVDG